MQGIPHVTGYDPTDAESLSDALIELRRQTVEMVETLSKNTEEFSSIRLGPFSSMPGIRESRRIVTDRMITKNDVLTGSRFDDGLFVIAQNIDIHKCTENDPHIVVTKAKPYHLPYGALIPKGLENVLVVGRCIGGDHEAQASYRIIADCLSMGEVAAQAANMAIQSDVSLRQVDSALLRSYMADRGYEV